MIQRRFAIPFLLLSGCMYPDGPFPHHDGTATIGWTIAGRWDDEACFERDASYVRIVVHLDRETTADDVVSCSTMVKRYVLDRGWYYASLTLLDASRSPVSDTRHTRSFYVSPGADTFVTVELDSSLTPIETWIP